MQKRPIFTALAVLIPVALLTACSGGGGYYKDDGPPSGFFAGSDFSNLPNATPKYEAPHRGANKPYVVGGKRYVPVTGDQPMTQRGTASWYGKKFHGRKTSTGETYNMYAMTAAHKTMELPSYAKVTNLKNGRSVIVRVNDRGPFVDNRIIDLSYAAARQINLNGRGVGNVDLEVISDENGTPLNADQAYYVRYASGTGRQSIGPFRAFADAATMHEAMRQAHPEAEVVLGSARE